MRNRFKTNRYSVAFSTNGNDSYTVIPNPPLSFVADPFLFRYNDDIFIFAEIYNYIDKKGCIGYSKYNSNTHSFGPWSTIISEKWHLSYPQIYTQGADIFIIPESNENNSIYLYRAISFPDKWEKVTTLYEGPERFVDTTLFTHNAQKYGFTYCIKSGEYANAGELRLFTLNDNGADIKNSIFITNDITRAREAGNIIERDSKLIRVSQDCKLRYGHGLCFSEFCINHSNGKITYTEKEIKRIYPQDIKINKKIKILQVHTYNELDHFSVIDIGYREHNLLLFFARIIALFHF